MTPDTDLLRELGLVGYLLLAVVAGGIALMSWVVKRLVDALISSNASTSMAVTEIVKHNAAVQELMDRISAGVEEGVRASTATLEIARQWQHEGARKKDA